MTDGDVRAGVSYYIELREVYDGWSIEVLVDGTVRNRWADPETGGPLVGYERRWRATQDVIEVMGAGDGGQV